MPVLFAKISGLNSVDDPVDIAYDPASGVSDAQVAVNCILSDRGRVSRAPGYSEVASGSFHSLFCDGGPCYVGKSTAIYEVGPDLSLTGVRSGLTGDRISWCQVGSRIYYTNGTEKGYIEDGQSYPWVAGTYNGADTKSLITGPPAGSHLAHNHGRIFVAHGNYVFWNKVPGEYDNFSLDTDHWAFPSRVIMLAAVDGGVFVSDEQKTYFRAGRVPSEAPSYTRANFPAYEWGLALDSIEGSDIGKPPGLYRVWVSREGLITGAPDGTIINETKPKIIYPETGQIGAAGVVGYHVYHSIGD